MSCQKPNVDSAGISRLCILARYRVTGCLGDDRTLAGRGDGVGVRVTVPCTCIVKMMLPGEDFNYIPFHSVPMVQKPDMIPPWNCVFTEFIKFQENT